jgi:hypothetical protein
MLPAEIKIIFKEQFSFPERMLFGSVATLKAGEPNIRFMRIYDINHEGCLILLTHTDSHKWKEFKKAPSVSVALLSENKQAQIIVRGAVKLDNPHTTPNAARKYWPLVRLDVKKIYDPSHLVEQPYSEQKLQVPDQAPITFGIATLVPTFWEVLELTLDYTSSVRTQFRYEDGVWQKKRVNVG